MLRIIIDTNLWISYLISKRLIQLDEMIANQKITLLFSRELLEEFIAVAQRPKFQKYFTADDLEQLLLKFDDFGELIEVTTEVHICRDPKDNFLLSLAQDGNADCLITGDKDLLGLQQFEGTSIVTFSDFISTHSA